MREGMITPAIVLLARMLSADVAPGAANQLTPAERKEGWRLLFDGKTTEGWRGFQKPDVRGDRWAVEDGALRVLKAEGESHGGADIVTVDTFSDFDLRWEWRAAPAANSGLKYLVTEERTGPIAHEYQIIDDGLHPDAQVGPHRQTAAFYDVLPPRPDKALRPVGEWNQSRVLVKGNHVEHWLNGRKVLEYELGSADLKAAIARSKFKDVAGFGTRVKGHILLQDHGDEVSYRALKILSPPR